MKSEKTTSKPVLRKVSRGYQITLPPAFREKAHLAIGDHVRIEQHGETLIITAVHEEKQRIADELMATLSEPIEGVSDFEDDEEAMQFALDEIKRYRQKARRISAKES